MEVCFNLEGSNSGIRVSVGVAVFVGVAVWLGVKVAVGFGVGFNARMISRCIYIRSMRRVSAFWSIRYHSESGSMAMTQTGSPSRRPSTILLLILGSDLTIAIGTRTMKS